jgi:hypothetical protein
MRVCILKFNKPTKYSKRIYSKDSFKEEVNGLYPLVVNSQGDYSVCFKVTSEEDGLYAEIDDDSYIVDFLKAGFELTTYSKGECENNKVKNCILEGCVLSVRCQDK